MALPKGRILKELVPLLEKAKITPEEEFFNPNSRKLLFTTNQKKLSIIKTSQFSISFNLDQKTIFFLIFSLSNLTSFLFIS